MAVTGIYIYEYMYRNIYLKIKVVRQTKPNMHCAGLKSKRACPHPLWGRQT